MYVSLCMSAYVCACVLACMSVCLCACVFVCASLLDNTEVFQDRFTIFSLNWWLYKLPSNEIICIDVLHWPWPSFWRSKIRISNTSYIYMWVSHKWWQRGQTLLLTSKRKYHIHFQWAYLNLTLAHSVIKVIHISIFTFVKTEASCIHCMLVSMPSFLFGFSC